MPATPHDYDITFWIGVGDALQTVRMEQYPNRDLAVIAGADALFEWAANDVDKPLPQAAIDFWRSTKTNLGLTFSDVQTELESRWGIQFSAKQADDNPAPPPPPSPAKRNDRHRMPVDARHAVDGDADITSVLKAHLAYKVGRARALSAEIAEKQKLLDRAESDITRMEMMLAATLTLDHKKGRNGQSGTGHTRKRRAPNGALGGAAKVRTRRKRSAGGDEISQTSPELTGGDDCVGGGDGVVIVGE